MSDRYEAGQHYGLADFDRHMCLTPGPWTWLVIAFLMRPYVVVVMSLANRNNRLELVDLVYPERLWLAVDALAALPAVVLVVAYGLRRPGARAWVRRVWARGRAWMLTAALANTAVAVVALVTAAPGRTTLVVPVLLCVSIWSLCYAAMARRVRDTFGDFPPDEADAAR